MRQIDAKRRQTDHSGMVWGVAKATAAFLFFGTLSFIGTWGVGLNTTVAKAKEDIEILKEKEQFLSIWLIDEVRRMHQEMKEVHQELRRRNK